jgi:large subunit ribosomal protein L29
MDAEKIRNLTDAELAHQQRELNDQLFRLKFQLKMGQTESLNKIRGLRKDVARIKTILREKELGLGNGAKQAASAKPAAEKKTVSANKSASAKKKTASAKKSAGAKAKARK